MTFRVLDLFSGIGGFSLGLERTGGFETVAFCEIEEFPRRVLAKHWPGVPIYDDVRTLTADRLTADGIVPDVICGGFPCQDISLAGKGAGIDGERSGLWREYARIIGELRPCYVIVENVAALLTRGLDRVLGDLAALGFDAEWHCIPASAVGAPHRRDRLWIVAHPGRAGRQQIAGSAPCHEGEDEGRPSEHDHVAPSHGEGDRARTVADAALVGRRQGRPRRAAWGTARHQGISWPHLAYADRQPLVGPAIARQERCAWPDEPPLDRVVDGVPHRLVEDELKALGNAVVPQVVEVIGRAILAQGDAP